MRRGADTKSTDYLNAQPRVTTVPQRMTTVTQPHSWLDRFADEGLSGAAGICLANLPVDENVLEEPTKRFHGSKYVSNFLLHTRDAT